MASRLLHYLIASEIIKRLKIEDGNRFCLGVLLPDLSSHGDGSYNRAHFWVELTEENKKGINWLLFKQKYAKQMENDSLYIGYYCHLIMDSLWFFSIVDKYIRSYPPEIKNARYRAGYQDYCRLNYLLSRNYNLHYNIYEAPVKGIEEVKGEELEEFLHMLRKDIQCTDVAEKEELEIYTFELMEEYINKSIEMCENEIKAFFQGNEQERPEKYYVKRL